jgi:hypothetical protein
MYTIHDLRKIILLGLVFISFPNRGVPSAIHCTWTIGVKNIVFFFASIDGVSIGDPMY